MLNRNRLVHNCELLENRDPAFFVKTCDDSFILYSGQPEGRNRPFKVNEAVKSDSSPSGCRAALPGADSLAVYCCAVLCCVSDSCQ